MPEHAQRTVIGPDRCCSGHSVRLQKHQTQDDCVDSADLLGASRATADVGIKSCGQGTAPR